MSKSPFKIDLSGLDQARKTSTDLKNAGPEIMKSFQTKAASMKGLLQAGQLNANNLADYGYARYGDITAEGYQGLGGEENAMILKSGRVVGNNISGGEYNKRGDVGMSFTPEKSQQQKDFEETARKAAQAVRLSQGAEMMKNERLENKASQERQGAYENNLNVASSMPEPTSSLVNPFGLQAQGAIGGTFGSLFSRQNSMGSALAKRACKYKNKK